MRLARKSTYGDKKLLYVSIITTEFAGICALKVRLHGFSQEFIQEQLKNKKRKKDPFAESPLMLLSKEEREAEIRKIKELRRQSNLCNFIVKNIRGSRNDKDARLERATHVVQVFEHRKVEAIQKRMEFLEENKNRINFEVEKLAIKKRLKGLLTDALDERQKLLDFSKQWIKTIFMLQIINTLNNDFKAAKEQVQHSVRASAMLKLYLLAHQDSVTKDGEDFDTRMLTTAGRGCLLVSKVYQEQTAIKAREFLGRFFNSAKHKFSLLKRVERFGTISKQESNLAQKAKDTIKAFHQAEQLFRSLLKEWYIQVFLTVVQKEMMRSSSILPNLRQQDINKMRE